MQMNRMKWKKSELFNLFFIPLNRLCADKKAVKHLECGEIICNFANVQRNEGLLIVPHFSY